MAKRVKKSGLLGKSLKAHAQDNTDYGRDFIDLPGGITGGIAKLVDAKIGTYKTGNNQGEQFLYLAGVVVEPKTAVNIVKAWKEKKVVVLSSGEVEIEGQRTSQTLPLCETTRADGTVTDADENVSRALNEVRKVGGEECTAGVDSEEALIEVLEALKQGSPFFRFSTSASDPTEQYPTPRVWENWRGACEYEESEEDEGEGVADDTEEPEGEEPDSEGEDLTALGELADTSDEDADALDAQRKLSDLAAEAGFEPDDLPTWSAVAEKLQEDDDDEEEEDDDDEEEEEETEPPEKGEVWKFKPPKKRKAVDCEVTAVFPTKKTCNLKNLEDGKVYKSIPWDKLETEE